MESNDYRQRIKTLQEKLGQSGLDAFVLRTDANIIYLIGMSYFSMERKVLLVVPAKGEPTLIVPRMEQERLSRSPSVQQVLSYWEMDAKPGRDWQSLLHKALGRHTAWQ